MELTKEKLDELVQEELCQMIKDDPARMVQHLLIQIGKMCVEANAETMDTKTQATLDGVRHEISCKMRIKKLKQ